MNKIIFLDFDGVLQIGKHDDPWMGESPLLEGYTDRDAYGLLFDKGCVSRLADLITSTNAKVVISSSWRFYGKAAMFDLWKDRQMPGQLIDITPFGDLQTMSDDFEISRGACIQEWLDLHPVDAYVILDDVDDMLDLQQKHFVQTNYDLGFQKKDLAKAIQMLITQ